MQQRVPDHYARTPDGLLLIADGLHQMKLWDGLTSTTEEAGVGAPTTAPTIAVVDSPGTIVGSYTAYVRFVDKRGNFSNLSPVSNTLTAQTSVPKTVTDATNATPIVITTSTAHGLSTGNRVKISGVVGNTGANGSFLVTELTSTTFSLDDSAGTGIYTSGGTVVIGVTTIDYTSVPVPGSVIGASKITRRQLLRNTDGQSTTYYVDIDTDDLTSVSFSSTKNDTTLSALTAVPLLEPDGSLSANRYGTPPNFKKALQHHLGRMFATAEVDYSQGAVVVTNGSATVTGIATGWTTEMAGRFLYVDGATSSYEILSVDESAQTITLTAAYDDSTAAYEGYDIRPAPAQRRLIYYTEANLPEAWPAVNALSLQEDGDDITGLMSKGSFIYILERRHIYRFTFQDNPATDGGSFLSAERGCINQRCWVKVEDRAYMLDQYGIHAFTGAGQPMPVSQAIQNIFEPNNNIGIKINWDAEDLFHASHYPAEETVRFFVCLSGFYLPRHALVFNYRDSAWWLEEFPFPISASATGTLANARRVFLGSEGQRTFLLDSLILDAVDPNTGTTRGTATAAAQTSITDSTASFPTSGLVGKSVTIVDGKGEGQRRIIHAASTTKLDVIEPWLILPDTTSKYQIGSVDWKYRGPWFRWMDSEEEEVRNIAITFAPTASESLLKVRIFPDYKTVPIVWEHTRDSDEVEGFGYEDGDSDLVAKLNQFSGYIQQRISEYRERNSAASRFMSLQLNGDSFKDPVTLYSVEYAGVEGG